MHAYQKFAFQVVWNCQKSLCGGGCGVGGVGGVESKFSDRIWPRPSQTIYHQWRLYSNVVEPMCVLLTMKKLVFSCFGL